MLFRYGIPYIQSLWGYHSRYGDHQSVLYLAFRTYDSFGAQTRFAKQNSTTLDTHFRASLYLFLVNRWIDIRSDTLGSVMTFLGGLLALHYRDLSPGLVGFSLVKATGLGDTILSLVRTLNELEIG